MEALGEEIVKALALIVAGVTLYTPYKIIGTAAKYIEQFGSDNEGKRETMRRILVIQGGGLFIFYGCYLVATGLICIVLEVVCKQQFLWFFIVGLIVSLIGLVIVAIGSFNKFDSNVQVMPPVSNNSNKN